MIVETRTTVSRKYYEKRNRRVVERAVEDMSRALGHKPALLASEMRDEPKQKLIDMAMQLHRAFPDA